MDKIRIYIVDDHEMFREGVKLLLAKSSNFEVIGEAANGKVCLDKMPAETDVVLMDIRMPELDGIETTRLLLEKHPEKKVIALSMFDDEQYYYQMIHAGVKGFVLKESGSRELETALLEVYNGRNFFSHELLRNIIFNLSQQKKEKQPEAPEIFTQREIEVLGKLSNGLSNKEIADELNISLRTVESHKSKLLQKTDSKNTIGLVMYAIRNGIIKINQ